ncbi:MAG: hypothetical protein KF760_28285 [Candidatus Eremiobacteraeota bacterium]|nr:hypothetical protein [Candidatus Eremiobacteraeota bacterium]MCW5865795.1 hypothetical protein [Candidatus Eremiobacteraeota bacterium]
MVELALLLEAVLLLLLLLEDLRGAEEEDEDDFVDTVLTLASQSFVTFTLDGELPLKNPEPVAFLQILFPE